MQAAPRRAKRATPVAMLTALVFVTLAVAAPALASAMTFSPPNPVAGDTVTALASSSECRAGTTWHYHWTVTKDGASAPFKTEDNLTNPWSIPNVSAGGYSVSFQQRCSDGYNPATDSGHFTVGTGLSGSISVSPDPPAANRTATLSAAATGGNPGYTFSWDLNNDGTFGDSTSRTPTYTFPTTGPHTVKVQITDNQGTTGSQNQTHTTTVSRTINVVASGGPPPPPPPPCIKTVTVKLSQFTTGGCFTQSGNRWTTTSAIKFNGISVPDYGQTFTITGATTTQPGRFTAPNSTLKLGKITVFSGNIDWTLPDGGPGDRKVLRSFSVAGAPEIAGFRASGQVKLDLGQRTDKSFYSAFGLNLELPTQFKAGPDPAFGSVSAGGSVTVDDKGVHYDGLKVQAKDVWLGKIKVASVCFSYVPAGGTTTTSCDPPSFGPSNNITPKLNGDEPFLSCNSDSNTTRWDGSAVVELPSELQLGAYGGVADGKISRLGGTVGNLGRRVPIADGIYLDHASFGLCLSPPPFKMRANAGVNFLGDHRTVSIDGGFTYVDKSGYTPWSLTVDGSLKVADQEVGKAYVGITALSSSPSASRPGSTSRTS